MGLILILSFTFLIISENRSSMNKSWKLNSSDLLNQLIYMGVQNLFGLILFLIYVQIQGNRETHFSPIQFILLYIFFDLLGYFYHFLSLRLDPLFNLHMIHHIPEKFNVLMNDVANTFHVLGFQIIFMSLCFFWGIQSSWYFSIIFIAGLINYYCHSNTNNLLGPLDKIFVNPQFHYLHHSTQFKGYGNYGASLTIWDKLFHTEILYNKSILPVGLKNEKGLKINNILKCLFFS